jgi:hypothetical protein
LRMIEVLWRECVVSGSRRFDEPIVLNDGTILRTLRDAIQYLGKTVPKTERDHRKVTTASGSPDQVSRTNLPHDLYPHGDAPH